MRIGIAIRICLLIAHVLIASASGGTVSLQSDGYGPEVKSFLEYMRHEEVELEFQIRHNEISHKDYIRSKNRIAVHRQTVLKIVRETGEDNVPELHVVAVTEVDELIENGTSALKHIKRGDVIAKKWRYIGSVSRGEVFYIFERLSAQ